MAINPGWQAVLDNDVFVVVGDVAERVRAFASSDTFQRVTNRKLLHKGRVDIDITLLRYAVMSAVLEGCAYLSYSKATGVEDVLALIDNALKAVNVQPHSSLFAGPMSETNLAAVVGTAMDELSQVLAYTPQAVNYAGDRAQDPEYLTNAQHFQEREAMLTSRFVDLAEVKGCSFLAYAPRLENALNRLETYTIDNASNLDKIKGSIKALDAKIVANHADVAGFIQSTKDSFGLLAAGIGKLVSLDAFTATIAAIDDKIALGHSNISQVLNKLDTAETQFILNVSNSFTSVQTKLETLATAAAVQSSMDGIASLRELVSTIGGSLSSNIAEVKSSLHLDITSATSKICSDILGTLATMSGELNASFVSAQTSRVALTAEVKQSIAAATSSVLTSVDAAKAGLSGELDSTTKSILASIESAIKKVDAIKGVVDKTLTESLSIRGSVEQTLQNLARLQEALDTLRAEFIRAMLDAEVLSKTNKEELFSLINVKTDEAAEHLETARTNLLSGIAAIGPKLDRNMLVSALGDVFSLIQPGTISDERSEDVAPQVTTLDEEVIPSDTVSGALNDLDE